MKLHLRNMMVCHTMEWVILSTPFLGLRGKNVLSTKYVKDYRMDVQTMPSGKVKRKMVYTGPFYEWDITEERLKGLRIRYACLAGTGWLLFLLSLSFYSSVSRVLYVMLPYACFMPILALLTGASLKLAVTRGSMNREDKDKICTRLKNFSAAGMVCGILTGIGVIASIFFQKISGGNDLLFAAADILLTHLCLYGFKSSRYLLVREKINPAAEEWENRGIS